MPIGFLLTRFGVNEKTSDPIILTLDRLQKSRLDPRRLVSLLGLPIHSGTWVKCQGCELAQYSAMGASHRSNYENRRDRRPRITGKSKFRGRGAIGAFLPFPIRGGGILEDH